MKADPRKSEGARMEREALREYLKRNIKKWASLKMLGEAMAFEKALKWVDGRHKRYDAKKGGLGGC